MRRYLFRRSKSVDEDRSGGTFRGSYSLRNYLGRARHLNCGRRHPPQVGQSYHRYGNVLGIP
jgi:hypothetical protein